MNTPSADSPLAAYINNRISILRSTKTQRQIAAGSGFPNPSMLSMIKRGEEKLPLHRVPALARAIGADAPELFRLAMAQYWSDKALIASIFSTPLTESEVEIIDLYRELTDNSNPTLTPEIEQRLTEIFQVCPEEKEL